MQALWACGGETHVCACAELNVMAIMIKPPQDYESLKLKISLSFLILPLPALLVFSTSPTLDTINSDISSLEVFPPMVFKQTQDTT